VTRGLVTRELEGVGGSGREWEGVGGSGREWEGEDKVVGVVGRGSFTGSERLRAQVLRNRWQVGKKGLKAW
jgi:hypothetical protein